MVREWLFDLKKLLYNKNMVVACLLILILGFTFGYYFTDVLDKSNEYNQSEIKDIENTKNVNEKDAQKDVVANNQVEDITITPRTQIVFELEYLKNETIDKEITTPVDAIIGLNEKEIKEYYQDWTLISLKKEEIILHKTIDSYSPSHFKVGITKKSGQKYITVFNYTKEGQEVVEFISDTPISILNKQEQRKLEEGMIFDNIEEVYRMLENYDL